MKLRFRKTFAILLSLAMLAASLPVGSAPVYAGEPTVIEITTPAELNAVRNNLSGHYRLGNDIDLGGAQGIYGTGYDDGKGWKPIVNFSGTFDGNGHTIHGLFINRPSGVGNEDAGLFSILTVNAQVFDLGLNDVDVNARIYVGGLAGTNMGSISNSHVEGKVSGMSAGGLVGYNEGSISNSHAESDVSGSYSGGLVGHNYGSINNSYATGLVKGDNYLGGLVGWNESEISESYAETNVSFLTESSNKKFIGGLVGINKGGSISESYFQGNITGTGDNVGGLAGYQYQGGSISQSYVEGNVSGSGIYVGGLVGFTQDSSISQSYVKGDVSGSGDYLGGLVGAAQNGSISQSYVEGDVSGSVNYVGGLVGYNQGCSISQSYTVGQIEGSEGVGGLVGFNQGGISESYSKGNLSAADYVGGLVGYNNAGSDISQSYAVGEVISSGDNTGGLIGHNEGGNIDDCYWDIQTSALDTSAGGDGRTTEKMKRRANFVDWDFAETWNIVKGQTYPYFQWQQDDDEPVEEPSHDAAVITKASHYVIDNNSNTINAGETPITTDVTVGDFLDNLKKHEEAEWKVVPAGTEIDGPVDILNAEGKNTNLSLVVGDKLAVLAEDDETFKVYTITVIKSPIKIRTAQELNQVRNDLTGYYVLENDIDLTGYLEEDGPGYNGGQGWEPISNFAGTFDGNGRMIRGLFINRPTSDNVGLFGSITSDAQIYNLGLEGVNVNGRNYVGALVGNSLGGIISQSYSMGTVSGSNNCVGGLVGGNSKSGSIGGTISKSYAVGNVSGIMYIGGLVGVNAGSISDSYAMTSMMGTVAGTGNIGGLVGLNGGNIYFSYATSSVTGSSNIGGLVGFNQGAVTACYWDTETTGQSIAGVGISSGAEGLTTAQMMQKATFEEGGPAWDFEDIWAIEENNSYPYLQWQGGPGTVPEDPSNDATVKTKGSYYIVDNNNNTIEADETAITTNVTVGDFLNNLDKDENAEWKVVPAGTEIIEPEDFENAEEIDDGEVLAVGDMLAVLAEDGLTLRVYEITVTDEPIEVSTSQELDDVRNKLRGHYILTDNIDLTDYLDDGGAGYNNGEGWEPIHNFKGIFDGNGHTINGLYINRPSDPSNPSGSSGSNVGLFGSTTIGAQIRDLGLTDVNVIGYDAVGGLVGGNFGSISQSYVIGSVTGTNNVGGLAGGSIGSISQSYAAGSVSGNQFVGGLTGLNAGSISESYANSGISGNMGVGGLTGVNNGSISKSYAAGSVSGAQFVGGLAGYNQGGITACYWDMEISGMASAGEGIDSGAEGLTTAQMKQMPSFENVGWDFENVWNIVEGKTYPYLRWQTPPDTGTPDTAPAIISQPKDQTVTAGQTAIFAVTAGGTEPLSYQWQKDGEEIEGATGPALTINNVQAEDAGSYTVTVSNEVDSVTSGEAILTVNEPGDLILTADLGNARVILEWNSVSEAVYYEVYKNNSRIATAEDNENSYEVTGLTNGTTYNFEVKATDSDHIVIAASGEISATPRTVPGAPSNVRVSAGNGQVTITFTGPEENGGSPITGYIVTASPGNIVVTGTSSPITITGLTNGTSYTFTVKAVNAAGESQSSVASDVVTPYRPSGGGGSKPATTPTTDVNIIPGTVKTTKDGGRTVTTVTLDDKKVEEKLEKEGRNTVITIPVKTGADVVIGQLNGQTVKNMEAKNAVLEIRTDEVTYVLPASQINIDALSTQMGKQLQLKDIIINVKTFAAAQDTLKIVENTADKNKYQIVVKPVEFEISGTTAGKTIQVSRFNTYVERILAIPSGVDPSKVTTGIVLNPDGSFSHVPTQVIKQDGKWYAKINSLTNSAYSIIWNPVTVSAVENHWSRESVNDLASRLVIKNPDSFKPDGHITRGEFAEYITKALGIYRTGAANGTKFTDVSLGSELADAITIATEYGIIAGYPDGSFKPGAKITREEAMVMYAKAIDIAGLKDINNSKIDSYKDKGQIGSWAYDKVKKTVGGGVFNGRTATTIDPKGTFTYAEAAAAIRNLLAEAELINK